MPGAQESLELNPTGTARPHCSKHPSDCSASPAAHPLSLTEPQHRAEQLTHEH